MSNVFNQELQDAIKGVYTLLEANELEQEKLTQAAKLGLYFAHGQTERASNKLITDQQKVSETGEELEEATDASEICNNVVTAANAASNNARDTNSSASTAAATIQAAANSLTNLAADTAAIYAVATSKNYEDKIQKLAERAYQLTQSASELAEKTTLQSLDTTVTAAQSRAAVALTQAKTLTSDTTKLLDSLNTNFTALQTKVNDDSTALTAAIAAESNQEGVFKTAREEKKAMQFSERFINKEVNYDLKYIQVGTDGTAFQVFFDSFDEVVQQILVDGTLTDTMVGSKYRIIFTEEDSAAAFDIHEAKATEHYVEIDLPSASPGSPLPSLPSSYTKDFITAELAAHLDPTTVSAPDAEGNVMVGTKYVAKDNTGAAVERGKPYVVFVYLVYNCDYQNEMNDTDGLLSLASLPFTLKTALPAAEKPVLNFYQHSSTNGTKCQTSNAVRVSFKVEDLMFQDVDLSEIADFRVILFNEDGEVASKLNHYMDKQLQILDGLDEAYRLTEQAYLDARQAYKTAIAKGSDGITTLKLGLTVTEVAYKEAAAAYNNQEEVIDSLNNANLSKFFLDTDILNQIPEGFAMIATAIDENYIDYLKEEVEKFEQSKTVRTESITDFTTQKEALNAEVGSLQADLETITENITNWKQSINDKEEEVRELLKDTDVDVEELLNLLKGNEWANISAEIVLLIELDENVTALQNIHGEIAGFKTNITDAEIEETEKNNTIKDNQRELISIKDQIETLDNEVSMIDNKINIFNAEVTELEAADGNVELGNKRAKLTELQQTLTEMEEKEASERNLKKVRKEIEELTADIAALEAEPETGGTRFIAVNEAGDFTDNYGEPMIENQSYTALVFSVVKSSEPDAIPLFQPVNSPFANSVVFTLPQL